MSETTDVRAFIADRLTAECESLGHTVSRRMVFPVCVRLVVVGSPTSPTWDTTAYLAITKMKTMVTRFRQNWYGMRYMEGDVVVANSDPNFYDKIISAMRDLVGVA